MGTVVLVEGGSSGDSEEGLMLGHLSREAPTRATPRRGRRGDKDAPSWHYPVPQAYMDLLQRGEAADSDTGEDAGARGSREWRQDFWKAARAAARGRIQDLPPDLGEAQLRRAQFHESLWLEELGVALALDSLRLTVDALGSAGSGLFALDVADVADESLGTMHENGLLRGVRVLIRCRDRVDHWGTLQPSAGASVLLLSGPQALAEAQGPFSVEFHPHRFQQLALHRALAAPRAVGLLRSGAAPETEAWQPGGGVGGGEPAQKLPQSLNGDQRRAIAAALRPGSSHPVVVWGPPGTGKSTLAAFIVWHIMQQQPTDFHVLVAAPSNTAADVLCAKLGKLGLGQETMLRLNALGRSVSTVPEAIRGFCSYDDDDDDDGRPSFAIPPLQQVRRFKVVVATCVCASHLSNRLRAAGSQEGWFSHVVVDEAGEATEPETLVPLALLRPVAGQVVLLGDHFQLGPLVVTPLARRLGRLDVSMMERLVMERFDAAHAKEAEGGASSRDALLECEDRGLFFLTESYRSHSAILSLYSSIFYAGKLEHRPRPQQLGLADFFEGHGLRGPVLLHNVVGAERQDPGSNSLYNVEEVLVVQRYVSELLEDRSLGLEPQDIGIITPYARQVQALERQFERLGAAFAGLECGTVERFQGQERRVVVISAVRCSRTFGSRPADAAAARRPIGFVADARRLNVAVSRAVAGLIVVGDLTTLSRHSSHWLRLLQLGQEMDAVLGQPLEPPARGGDAVPAVPPAQRDVPAAEAQVAWDALTSS